MPPILPSLNHNQPPGWFLTRNFLPYQVNWILNDAPQLLAEKSVRIGWTFADAYKNVRRRLERPKRDYLFATKDYSTALEYMHTCQHFCDVFGLGHYILSRGEESLKVPVYEEGRCTGLTEEIKAGVIRFQNRSRIIAFSSNPNALRAYGGDVGLDEFAFHPSAQELWAAAAGRATWGFDLAIWSSHNGPDTLFAQFAREAATGQGRWSYYRVTLPDAIDMGLVEKINQTQRVSFSRDQFLADCRSRARFEDVFDQEYLCLPGGGGATIVSWDALERCLDPDPIERQHLEEKDIRETFGVFYPSEAKERRQRISQYIHQAFPNLFRYPRRERRLGFDVAASGRGSLSVFYLDQTIEKVLQLEALFTCRTEDWHFLKSVLHVFMMELRNIIGCGDETGLGRQICWEANHENGLFMPINFSQEKSKLGLELMDQLALGRKRFPRLEPDIAADYFALRKRHTGGRWVFTEYVNPLNSLSHCDIAWAGALATCTCRDYPPGASWGAVGR